MRPNFKIGSVTKILDDNLVIEVECGKEFKTIAYPIFSLKEIKEEDEVLLISAGKSTEMYFYMLLRLDSTFYTTYKNMVLGFDDDHIVARGNIKAEGDIEFIGNVKFLSGSEGGSIELKNARPVKTAPPGIFCSIDVCPYTGQPHTTSKVIITKDNNNE